MTHLAIRLFESERKRLPETLGELVPQYLSARLADPYHTGFPLPLHYRRNGARYVLYSVGPDGQDDGGRFGSYTDAMFRKGFAFDIDVSIVEER